MIPSVQEEMEGCPDSNVNVLYMVLTGVLSLGVFLVYEAIAALVRSRRTKKSTSKKNKLKDAEFRDLQIELYGVDYMSRHGSLTNSEHSTRTPLPPSPPVDVKSDSGSVPNKNMDANEDEVST
jgi:hypothetical protein